MNQQEKDAKRDKDAKLEETLNKLINTKTAFQTEVEKHEYLKHTIHWLWCIDRDPKEVDIERIRENAFQLHYNDKDTLAK